MNVRTTGVCIAWVVLAAGCASRQGPAAGEPQPTPVPGADYHQIMGQIAADRGATAVAVEEFLNVAERDADPQASRQAAGFAFEHGYDAAALRAARRWAQLEPAEPAARLLLARLLVRRNDIAGAAAEAARALGPAEGREEADYELLADELAAEGNAEGVTRVLTRLAATSPASPALGMAIAAAALRSGDLDLAEVTVRDILAAGDGDTEQLRVLLSRVLLARGESDAAVAQLQELAAAQPSLDLDLEVAGMLAAADRPGEALEHLAAAALRYGREPGVRRLQAVVSQQTGALEAAWEGFNSLADDEEYADEARFRMAEIAAREMRFDQALKLLGRIGEGPFLLPAQETIARIAEASGDSQSALQILDRVAARHPELAFDVARGRAAMLQRLKRDDEALAELDRILRHRPDDADVLLARGALLERMDRLDAALADMAAAVRLFPDSAVAANAYGYTLANRTRRQDEARRLVRRAFERDSTNAAIVDSFGWVLYRQHRLAEAHSYLQLAYTLFPDPEVAAHLGEVMWRQGERDAARQLWADALEKSPQSQPLLDTMARFGD
ncbi:MAG: tetratricopeptide repeat protein [Gammaproteobacteria bacterium]|nr:tetratricopeptide repeat protein [Gammaproteobacteria bacterium]